MLTRKARLPAKAVAVTPGKQLRAVPRTPAQEEGGLTWAEEFQPGSKPKDNPLEGRGAERSGPEWGEERGSQALCGHGRAGSRGAVQGERKRGRFSDLHLCPGEEAHAALVTGNLGFSMIGLENGCKTLLLICRN